MWRNQVEFTKQLDYLLNIAANIIYFDALLNFYAAKKSLVHKYYR